MSRLFEFNGRAYSGTVSHTQLDSIITVHITDMDILGCFGKEVPELDGKKLLKFTRYGDMLKLWCSTFEYSNISYGNSNSLSYPIRITSNIGDYPIRITSNIGDSHCGNYVLAANFFGNRILFDLDDTQLITLPTETTSITIAHCLNIPINGFSFEQYNDRIFLRVIPTPVGQSANWKDEGF